jgi:hypothetical protein
MLKDLPEGRRLSGNSCRPDCQLNIDRSMCARFRSGHFNRAGADFTGTTDAATQPNGRLPPPSSPAHQLTVQSTSDMFSAVFVASE